MLDAVRPDVMVLDLLMPVMHGWAFMENYIEKTEGRRIPIVVVSVNPALPRSFNRLGVRHVVAKPFELDALVDAVEQRRRDRLSRYGAEAQRVERLGRQRRRLAGDQRHQQRD